MEHLLTFRTISALILFILMYISGIRMRQSGRPYNLILLNLHRLISLAAMTLAVVAVIPMHSGFVLTGIHCILGILIILFGLVTLVTGFFLNVKDREPRLALFAHKYLPYLLLVALVLMILLLTSLF